MKRSEVGPDSTRTPLRLPVLVRVDAEEGGHVGDAGGLLHVVGDDHDRVVALEHADQLLDGERRDRVERRGRLVHQDHVRLDRQRPRDAEPLLLAAGERQRAVLEAVLDLVPQRRMAQRLLDAVAEVVLHPVNPQAERDVVVDRLRERVGPLEHHPDATAHLDRHRRRLRTGPGRGR